MALAKCLRIDDPLVLLVHRGDSVVPLDHPVAAWHLGTVVVRDVALDRLALSPGLLLIALKPHADFLCLGLQVLHRLLLFLPLTRLGFLPILFAVPF